MIRNDILVVTGGLGFIGKHFVRRCLDEGRYVRNFDQVSYAADLKVREEFEAHDNYRFHEADIATLDFLPECDCVVNFAAESHVDNAITSNRKFCETNFLGVQNLLELVRMKQAAERPMFMQISTDEVYGDITEGQHSVDDRLIPSNPYSATKAAADMLVQSWGRTYDVEYCIVRPSNNYGPHQYPEKLIPKSAWRMKRGVPAILHGDGSYIRSWLHVEDTVDALLTIIEKGERQAIYNIGANIEVRNIDVLRAIAKLVGRDESGAWVFRGDRIGQDVRYSVDDASLRALGWEPKRQFFKELDPIIASLDFRRFR